MAKRKPWLEGEWPERYSTFCSWYERQVAQNRLQPVSHYTKEHMRGHFYHCYKKTKKDGIFDKLDVVERGVQQMLPRFTPTFRWLIMESADRGYGIVDCYEKGMMKRRAELDEVRQSKTGD